ncbi:MAG TPA: efflux RND transporter periplasmic adaptor subunit [Rhizomicrobium sp.]|nr:efflux RND transporter periplasmic adaptor subunit [Rhizomicrobium sp.]
MLRHLSVILVAAAALCACSPQRPQRPPPQVGYMVVREQPVQLIAELPGRTDPYAVSNVEPQVTGIILKRLFTEGSMVKEGQSLYQIDPRPYQAALDQAQGQLAQAQANLTNARRDLGRYQSLQGQNAISQQTLDTQSALVGSDEGIVKSDRANVEAAHINLRYTKVIAPISGRIGASAVTPGALVTANQGTPLAVISTLDPIYVDINQSSDELLTLEQQARKGQVNRNQPLAAKVSLKLGDGSDYPLEGKLQFTDVTVSQATGTVLLRALFPNPDGILLPGLYVRAVINEGVDPHGILVPQNAVGRTPKGEPTVLTVDDQNMTRLKVLKTGRMIGGDWQVLDGLKAGDKVVVQGLMQGTTVIQPDMKVTPSPVKAPPAASGAQ